MKVVRSYLRILLARKEQQAGRTISLRELQRETSAPMSTVMGLANNTMKEIPVEPLVSICGYLGCEIGDLLKIEEAA